MKIDRRKFLALSGASITAAYLGACDSFGPASAQGFLKYAEKKNEGVERFLLRHTSMDQARSGAHKAGAKFPSYFVSDEIPMWDEKANCTSTLEVHGAV